MCFFLVGCDGFFQVKRENHACLLGRKHDIPKQRFALLNVASLGVALHGGEHIRWGQCPDGVCLVVGTCARGFENNNTSDFIYTRTLVTQVGSSKTQYFWEVRFFPPFFFFNPY
jgi:hypothetical protein